MRTPSTARATAETSRESGVSFIDLCCGCGGFTRGLVDVGLTQSPVMTTTRSRSRRTTRISRTRGTTRTSARWSSSVTPRTSSWRACPAKATAPLASSTLGWPQSALGRLRPARRNGAALAGAVENVVRFLDSRAHRNLETRLIDLGYFVASGVVRARTLASRSAVSVP
jgi:hypothetical protein